MYFDMGIETLKLTSCELKLQELTVHHYFARLPRFNRRVASHDTDMGLETLELTSCESKLRELTVSPIQCAPCGRTRLSRLRVFGPVPPDAT